jgi:hypothetical protein
MAALSFSLFLASLSHKTDADTWKTGYVPHHELFSRGVLRYLQELPPYS